MICYVVLHYNDIAVTKECVNNIKKTDYEDKIFIVDNCSPNGSGNVIKECYIDVKNTFVLLLNRNVGFAPRNSAGYELIKRWEDKWFQ